MFKRRVFSLHVKISKVFAALTDSGKLYQSLETATEKARPDLVLVCGTM